MKVLGMKNKLVIVLLFHCCWQCGWLFAQDGEDVRVYSEDGEKEISFYVDNDLFIPASVYINFESLVNLSPTVDLPFSGLIEPGAKAQYLFSLIPGSGRRISYSLTYRYSRGDPRSIQADEDYLYSFPYAHGTKQRVTQGFNGRYTHENENSYAIDFDLAEGTEIFAARAGVVVEVKEESNRGGPSPQYSSHANYILIMHSDGTMGNYVHLQQNGALVDRGEQVRLGQLIAYSGDTGRSSGPHLHFDVRVPQANGKMQSIPIRFKGANGEAIVPTQNEFYYASHEGGEPFTAVYGADLSNEDFVEHRGSAQQINKLDIRVEQIDRSYILFIGNGLPYNLEASVDLHLSNMTASDPDPITISLKTGEEKFLTILRPVKGAASWRYGYSLSYQQLRLE